MNKNTTKKTIGQKLDNVIAQAKAKTSPIVKKAKADKKQTATTVGIGVIIGIAITNIL